MTSVLDLFERYVTMKNQGLSIVIERRKMRGREEDRQHCSVSHTALISSDITQNVSQPIFYFLLGAIYFCSNTLLFRCTENTMLCEIIRRDRVGDVVCRRGEIQYRSDDCCTTS